MRSLVLPGWASGLLGAAALVGAWWVASLLVPSTGSYAPIPAPPAVLQALIDDGVELYWSSFAVTITEAGLGYLWGNLIAIVLAALVLVVPWLDGVISQLAVITYCVPIVAIGPLAIVILGGARGPGEPSSTAVFFAALSVVFTTVVGTLLGLKAADRAALDVVAVYGGSRLTQLRKVRLIAALPAILNALQIAVPAAFLGAILGEYFGKIDRGVGPMLVASQVSLNSPRVWALFLLCAVVAIAGFALVGLVARLVAPWSSGRSA
ncbi:ABC transporter permease [Naasia sp. SYSU D00948]|uniref:ABC transporter permease n=1 Tax=Naasia sp. SYSU D00948 TaxID=2817379 RepID=UPI001B315570|nr:ABC transporter permease subunit [Naasia sp. SYSU D00948]